MQNKFKGQTKPTHESDNESIGSVDEESLDIEQEDTTDEALNDSMAALYVQRMKTNADAAQSNSLSSEQPSSTSSNSSMATMYGLLAAGTVATAAATTKIETKGNVLSSNANLGPIQGSNYVGIKSGDAVSGQSSSINLGVANTSKSEQHTFGAHGTSTTKSSGWNIGGVGCNNTTHSGIGEKGKLYNYKTEGNFFGEHYKMGFDIPAPDLSKVAKGLAHAAHSTAGFFEKAGPSIVQGAEQTAKVISHVGKEAGPAIVHAAHVAGPVIIGGAKLVGSGVAAAASILK